jgi:hypothetical protein
MCRTWRHHVTQSQRDRSPTLFLGHDRRAGGAAQSFRRELGFPDGNRSFVSFDGRASGEDDHLGVGYWVMLNHSLKLSLRGKLNEFAGDRFPPWRMYGSEVQKRPFHKLRRVRDAVTRLCFADWCPRGDSNPHAVKHRLLRPACLPVPPPGQKADGQKTQPRRPAQEN